MAFASCDPSLSNASLPATQLALRNAPFELIPLLPNSTLPKGRHPPLVTAVEVNGLVVLVIGLSVRLMAIADTNKATSSSHCEEIRPLQGLFLISEQPSLFFFLPLFPMPTWLQQRLTKH